MGLADTLFAAKPPVGTPPFAPTPWEQTGGANVPTTPDTLPVKQGLAGLIDRFVNPTNALGQIGRALVMAGGSPIGRAYMYMDQMKRQGQDDALEHQYKLAQIQHLTQPEVKVGPLQQKINDLKANGASPEQIRSFIAAETNPMAALQVTDPATGESSLRFYSTLR